MTTPYAIGFPQECGCGPGKIVCHVGKVLEGRVAIMRARHRDLLTHITSSNHETAVLDLALHQGVRVVQHKDVA